MVCGGSDVSADDNDDCCRYAVKMTLGDLNYQFSWAWRDVCCAFGMTAFGVY
jgi:hypothetical protein